MFNLSIVTGVFPNSWKVARVAPIYKSGPENEHSNYRPISVLPFLSRAFEKVVYNQLYEYLNKNKLIYSGQSGSRSLHSVVTCLLSNTNDWYLNMDKGNYTAMVFIDLKKAFDTVDHDLLLKKLNKYGIGGLEHKWFSSYLNNRKQFCKVNGFASQLGDIKFGVPQGSCLGPLLFLLYINDLPFALNQGNVTMYVDDTSISYSSKNIEDIKSVLDEELAMLNEWLQSNKLSLNVVKTQSMVVGSRPNLKKIDDQAIVTPRFCIGGSQIEIVDQTKYLGVILDKYLSWDQQIRSIRTKVSRALGMLKYSKKFLPTDLLSKMYRSLVEPHFRYCCSIWGCCGETKLQSLQKLQNRAARIVTNSAYDASAIKLIQSLSWPLIAVKYCNFCRY